MREIKLKELKKKSPTELLTFAEEHEVENASIMRKQELMFAILKQLATKDIEIIGEGVVEILQDGFGFLRSPMRITSQDPTISMYLHRKSVSLACGQETPSRVSSVAQERASDILRCSNATRSILRILKRRGTRCTLTISRRYIRISGYASRLKIRREKTFRPA